MLVLVPALRESNHLFIDGLSPAKWRYV